MIEFYGYKKCSTCRKAESFLQKHAIPYTFKDITSEPPAIETIRRIHRLSGLPLKKLFNTSGVVYREMGLKDRLDSMTESDIFSLLAENGRLIRRPVCFDGKKATIGFREGEYESNWVI